MSNIRIYKATEIESIRLHTFATACTEIFKSRGVNMEVIVEDIYFDYGQNWWYSGLITIDSDTKHSVSGRWQSVCPRDYAVIINCDSTADLLRLADYYVEEVLEDNICVNLKAIA